MPSNQVAAVLPIQVRTYTPADHKAVAAIFRMGVDAYHAGKPFDELPFHMQHPLQHDMAENGSGFIDQFFFAPGGHFWVATTAHGETGDETVVGCVALEKKSETRADLRRMFVHEAFRRRGVAVALVAHVETSAKSRGFQTLGLATGSDMAPAMRLYESLGFSYTHSYEQDGAVVCCYEKAL